MAITIKPSHKGELHRDLGVPQGEKIPAKKLAKAADSSDPAERKRAVFAENAKKFNHSNGHSNGTHGTKDSPHRPRAGKLKSY